MNHIYFSELILILIITQIYSTNSKLLENTRNLKSKYSEIHLVIQGSGTQDLVSSSGYSEADDPSEVYVGGSKREDCLKTCSLTGTSNSITLRFENQMASCSYMFFQQTNIIEVDLSDFDASKVTSMGGMFNGCTNLEKFTSGNINTPLLETMSAVFNKCSSLTSIDISNFDTSKVTTMKELFKECSKLETINFGNIDTSSVKTMEGLFYSCTKLVSVDLSKFQTSEVTCMSRMFLSCTSLKYLDLSSFSTPKVEEVPQMFKSCSSLFFLNIKNFVLSGLTTNALKEVLSGVSSTIKYCVSDSTTQTTLSISSSQNDCSDTCFKQNIKVDITNNQCIEDLCGNDEYKYIYNEECYTSCPEGTYELDCEQGESGCYDENNKKLCYNTLPEGYYLDTGNNIYKKCFTNCKSCYGAGTESNNNCKECKNNLVFLSEENVKTNCYEKCSNYYYFDATNNYNCLDSCQGNYNKIIPDKKKCIDNCKNDDTYKYEYNNNCYTECSSGTYLLEDKNDNICYAQAPDGYYLDTVNNIFKKCYETCSKCNAGGNELNNNCLECKTNYVFYTDNNNNANCYEKCDNYYYFDDSNNFFCFSSKKCSGKYNKLIKEKSKCTDDCAKDDLYQYEYKNICYQNEIIETTIIQSKIKNTNIIKQEETKNPEKKYSYSTNIVDKNHPTNIVNQNPEEESIPYSTNTIIQNKIDVNVEVNEINVDKIKEILILTNNSQNNINININDDNNITNNSYYLEIQDKVLENIQEIINTGLDTENIDNGNDITFSVDNKANKVSYTITTTSNQKSEEKTINNNSRIDLGECEYKLKDKYNISKNNSLYILKVDIVIDSIHKVEYDVYYPFTPNNLTKLNLTVCQNTKVDISIPAIIPIDELDKYNKSSALYNDICYTLKSETGTDKILEDRQKDFAKNNLSVCEEDCDFEKYDNDIKKAICSCYTKIKLPLISEIKVDKDKMISNFKNIKNIGNFKMLKCWNLLYDKKNIFKNSANYMVAILLFLNFISIFTFACCNIKYIKKMLNQFRNKNTYNKMNNINNRINNKKINKKNNNNKLLKSNFNKSNNNKTKSKNYLLNSKNNFRSNQNMFMHKNKNNNLNRFGNLINLNLNNFNNNNIMNNNYFINKRKQKEANTKKVKLNLNQNKSKPKDNKIKKKYNRFQLNNTKNPNTVKKLNTNKNLLNANKKKFIKFTKPLPYNDLEMNLLRYELAKIKDTRSYFQYYISLLRTKHILIFTFCQRHDYNSGMIKIFLFFLTFSINYLISAMFYSDSTMHKIYEDEGSFDFTYQLPQMFYSFIISTILQGLLSILGLYEQSIIEYRINNKNDYSKVLLTIRIKIAMFFIITFLLLFFLWVYLGCFCAVYKNTQIHLLMDVASSFGISFISPFFIYLLPGMFRIPALKKNTKRPMMYKFSRLLQLL